MTPPASLAMALLGALVGVGLSLGGWRAAAAVAIVGGIGFGVTAADLADRRIPTRIVLIGAAGLVVAVLVDAVSESSAGGVVLAALGAVLIGGAFLLVYLLRPAAIGFGDVRLATVIGAAVAWGSDDLTVAIVATAVASLMATLFMAITQTRSIPFAPCLVPAAVVVIVATALA